MEDPRHTSTSNMNENQDSLCVFGCLTTPDPNLPEPTIGICRRDVIQGLVHLSLFGIICVIHHVAWLTATQFSVPISALVLLYLVHVLYLCIYGMGKYGVICPKCCNDLVGRVEKMSFVGNIFVPNSTLWRPQRLWEGLVGIGRGHRD